MKDLVVRSFQGQEVRSVTEHDGSIWINANDVCAGLGIKNVSDATKKLDEDERRVIGFTDDIGRQANMLFISEPGLYRLLARSNKPAAKPFQDFLCKDLLVNLRKTGSYSLEQRPLSPAELFAQNAQILLEQEKAIKQHSQAITTIQTRLDVLKSYVEERTDNISGGTGYYTIKAFLRRHKMTLPIKDSQALGRCCAKRCKDLGVRTSEVADQSYGFVRAYPEEIITECATALGLIPPTKAVV